MRVLAVPRRSLRLRPAAELARETTREIAGGRLAELPISLRFWDGSLLPGPSADSAATPPTLVVRRPRALAHLLHEPSELGLSRAWVDGSLAAEGDLEAVLALRAPMQSLSLTLRDRARILLAALRAAGPAVLRRPPVPAIEATVGGERHSLRRAREAVRHHYDVSNDFYRLVLGPSMVYSCAYFSEREDTLEEAQRRKLDVICRKLDLRAGVSDRVEIRVADYRVLAGRPFDKVASVGMYEHVGRAELAAYVRTIHDLLRPGGMLLNHGIAQLRPAPLNSKSFIARYIFPDGELHPLSDLISALAPEGLEVRDVESLREHYALTLRRWVANLRARRREAEALVGSERVRTWELYLAGSARAFEGGEITIYQVLAVRPDGPHALPLDRLELLSAGEIRTST